MVRESEDLYQKVMELNKELQCLHEVTRVVDKHLLGKRRIQLGNLFQEIVQLIPRAYRYSDITCARIIFGAEEFRTANFEETDSRQVSTISVDGDETGTVEVYYLEGAPQRRGNLFLEEEQALLDNIAMRLGKIAERALVVEELESSDSQLRSLISQLQTSREDARKNLTHELHDELGQLLTGLKMRLSLLEEKLPRNQKLLIEKTQKMMNIVDQGLETVHKICTRLRPPILDDLGLTEALKWQVQEFQEITGIDCEANVDRIPKVLDQDISIAIFRILQELLTNVARHANATITNVELTKRGDILVLKVKDNGKGITAEQIKSTEAIGLLGVRERVRSLNGKLRFYSIKGKGTTVKVTIPVNRKGSTS